MLRQTVRNLYNWKGATLSPLDQNDEEEADPSRDAHNGSQVSGSDDEFLGTIHNNNSNSNNTSWEEQEFETETHGFHNSSGSVSVNVVGKSHLSAKLQVVATIVTVTLLVLMVLSGGLYLYFEHRRQRLEREAQAGQEAQAAQEAQRGGQQEQTVRQAKIKTKLKLVEFSEPSSRSAATTVPCGHTDSESDTCYSESGSSGDDWKQLKDSANSHEPCDNETDNEQPAAPQEEPQNTTEKDVDTAALDPATSDNDDDDHCCYICLTRFEEREIVSASNNKECKHMYHKECIEAWLLKQDGCPICRRNYLDQSDQQQHGGNNEAEFAV